jgi:hypothetical protein
MANKRARTAVETWEAFRSPRSASTDTSQRADDLDDITPEDRAQLKTAIDDVAGGGPRAEVGAARIKRMVGKAGTAVGQALWKISVEVASEAAKKILLGN